ncbi:MAG: hypothetical protein ACI965_001517 [Paraglaciecola sp.]|jgi:hypothetical protein
MPQPYTCHMCGKNHSFDALCPTSNEDEVCHIEPATMIARGGLAISAATLAYNHYLSNKDKLCCTRYRKGTDKQCNSPIVDIQRINEWDREWVSLICSSGHETRKVISPAIKKT